MHPGNLLGGVRHVGEAPCHKLVERRPETVDVAAHIGRNAGELFRTDVLRSTHHLVSDLLIPVFIPGHPGKTKVGQLGEAVGVQHDVIRLDVLVNQFLLTPRRIKSTGNLTNHLGRLHEVKLLLPLENLFEGLPPHILHRKVKNPVLLANRIGLHDVRMVDLSCRPRLAEKTLDILLVVEKSILQHLERHRPVQRKLPGEKHLTHAPLADLPLNQKISDHRSG